VCVWREWRCVMDGGRWTGWDGSLGVGVEVVFRLGSYHSTATLRRVGIPTFKRPPTPRRMCHGNHSDGGRKDIRVVGFPKGRVEK
jgi:hypothetical protein